MTTVAGRGPRRSPVQQVEALVAGCRDPGDARADDRHIDSGPVG